MSTIKNPGALKMTTLFRGNVITWKHPGIWLQLGREWEESSSMSIPDTAIISDTLVTNVGSQLKYI